MGKAENKKGLKLINQNKLYLKKLAQVYIKIKVKGGNRSKEGKINKITNEQAKVDSMRSRGNQ